MANTASKAITDLKTSLDRYFKGLYTKCQNAYYIYTREVIFMSEDQRGDIESTVLCVRVDFTICLIGFEHVYYTRVLHLRRAMEGEQWRERVNVVWGSILVGKPSPPQWCACGS